jgi:hypothetical protein
LKKGISNNVWDKKVASPMYRETSGGYQSKDSDLTWHGVQPQSVASMTVNMPIPELSRTIRHGSFIDVSFEIAVTVGFVSTNIPITILHPLSFVDCLPGQTKPVLQEPPLSVSRSVVAGVLGLSDEPVFVSNVTLADMPDYPREPDIKSVATSTFKRRLGQKPIISSPSPVSMLQSKLSIKNPTHDAPSILSRGAKKQVYDDTSSQLDLNDEMEKLYQMVQTSR